MAQGCALILAWVCWLGTAVAAGAASTNATATERPAFAIDVWQTEDGLPQNSVIAIAQSRDGYLWLGTLNGLVRFDGTQFAVFDENNTPGLESSRIVFLFEDSAGNLWVGSETAGLALVRTNGEVKKVELGRGSREGRVVSGCEDAGGAVWLYTAEGELGRHRDGAIDVFRPTPLRFGGTRVVAPGENGGVLLGTEQGVIAVGPTPTNDAKAFPVEREWPAQRFGFLLSSRKGGHWRLVDGRIQKWSASSLERDLGPYPWGGYPISAACEDQSGNLIVGTLGGGLFWFDEAGAVRKLSTTEGLSHNHILALHMDREGTLWVGTDGGGLNRVRRQLFDVLDASRGRVAQTVCQDARGGLWIGYNGGGVDHWSAGALERFGSEQAMGSSPVRAVMEDRANRVWAGAVGNGAGLFQFLRGRFDRVVAATVSRDVFALFEDRRGRIWVGTGGGAAVWDGNEWSLFTTREGLSSDVVRAIAEGQDGDYWFGTRGGGLNRMRDGKFTVYRKPDGLPANDVVSLLMDADQALWVGTDGGGLARWRGGKWTSYSKRDGLVSNSIGYLLDDGEGYLWIGSNAGLMRVLKKALNDFADGRATFLPVRTYGTRDGLPSSECTSGSQPAACRTRDGNLWFPTIKGLVSVNPARLRPNTNPPPVAIDLVLVDGQAERSDMLRAPQIERVTLPAAREHLEIHYSSLNLAAPERARFRYRLQGHETAWTEAGNTRIAHYSKLSPGGYQFQVTACNEDGVWNEKGAALAVVVEPPFWRTRWFMALCGALLIGLVVAVIRVIGYFSVQRLERQLAVLRQQEAVEKERARIARDIHDQLGANLTQVALLGELVEGDKDLPAEVEAHGRQIAQTARETTRTLDEIVWTVNPANDTLDGLVNYICKSAQDYLSVAGLRYRLEVPPALPHANIAPEVRHNVFLAAKEAVTNIVRHAKAKSAWLRLHLEPAQFTIEISDDGRGLAGMDQERAATRNGLRNMRKRMEDIGGTFAMDAAPEGGLRVRLSVPLKPR